MQNYRSTIEQSDHCLLVLIVSKNHFSLGRGGICMLYVMADGLSKIFSSEKPTGTAWLMIFGGAIAI